MIPGFATASGPSTTVSGCAWTSVDVEVLLQRPSQLAVVLAYPSGAIDPVVDVFLAGGGTLQIVVGTGVALVVG